MIHFECPNCGSRIYIEDSNGLLCKSCGNFYTQEMLVEMERHKKQMSDLRRMEEERRLHKEVRADISPIQTEKMIQYVQEMLAHRNFDRANETLKKLQEANTELPIIRILYTRYLLQAKKFSSAIEIIDNWEKAFKYIQGDNKNLLQEWIVVYDDELWGCFDGLRNMNSKEIIKNANNIICIVMMILSPYVDGCSFSSLKIQSRILKSKNEDFTFRILKWLFGLLEIVPYNSQTYNDMNYLMNMCANISMCNNSKTEIYEKYLLFMAGIVDSKLKRDERRLVIAAFRDGVLPLLFNNIRKDLLWTEHQENIYNFLSKLDRKFNHEQKNIVKQWRGESGKPISENHINVYKRLKKIAIDMGIPYSFQMDALIYAMVKQEQSILPSKWKYHYQPQLDEIFELWPELRDLHKKVKRMFDEDKEEIRKLHVEMSKISQNIEEWKYRSGKLEEEKKELEYRLYALKQENGFSLFRSSRISKCEKEICDVKEKLELENHIGQQYMEKLTQYELKIKLLENKAELLLRKNNP